MRSPMLSGSFLFCVGLLCVAVPAPARAQELGCAPTNPLRICPGDPPGNLATRDCSFRAAMRLENFVTTSVSEVRRMDRDLAGAPLIGAGMNPS